MTRYSGMPFAPTFGLILTLLLFAGSARATTITELHFSDVVAKASLVFEGRVTGVEARQTSPRMIKTQVTFEVLDVIKGQFNGSELTLSFTGGRVGQRQLQIVDLQIPSIGESGIYFVEDLQKEWVNPLVGWSQGHFLINEPETQTRQFNASTDPTSTQAAPSAPVTSVVSARTITTAKGRPVTRLESRPSASPAEPMPLLAPGAAARGVQISAASAPATALSVDAFKTRVREMVRAQESGQESGQAPDEVRTQEPEL